MISPELIAKIRRLFFAEHWKIGTIAAELGLHPDTVRSAIESHRFNLKRVAGSRARLTDPYLDFITQTLTQYPGLRATRLYEMVRQRGYTGSVVQLRRVVRCLRPTKREAFLRLNVLPGEQAQADWAHFGQVRVGRAVRKLSCFVMTLSHSRALWVEFFFDQSLENLLLGHIHAFRDWGGVPRTILYDNMASVVSERRGDAIAFHPRLLELCAHYHFDARPCRPARGNEKGRVERAIQYIRHSFFAARSFASPADLNRQALVWRDQIAHQRPWPGDDACRVIDAFDQEQPRLLPLPVNAFDTNLIKPIRSDKTIYVRFDLNDYSIPPEAVGRQLTLVASPQQVRLLDGAQEIARHRRSYDRHARIEDPGHIEALVKDKRKALGATAASRLSAAAPRIEEFLDAAFARGENLGGLSRKLIELLDDYGAQELRAAIDEALERQTPRAASLALILEQRRRRSARKLPPVDLSSSTSGRSGGLHSNTGGLR
ncbi:MAG: IS21 family transposase [Acidobacteriota bacterium]|nr:MAG: IS21 family transposase [Acidobacteriota bacterium]